MARSLLPAALVAVAVASAAAALGGGGGTAWWDAGGEAYAQSAPGGEKHPLQARIDAAPSGGTVAVGPGIYGDAVLTIGKPLTLTSETGQPGAAIFTGESRIVVNSSYVTIAGLSFHSTDCAPGGGAFSSSSSSQPAPVVEILTDIQGTYAVAAIYVKIVNNAFRDTCGAAIQSAGGGGLGYVGIHGNVLENVGTGPAGGSPAPGAIVLAHANDTGGTVHGRITGNHIDGAGAAGILVSKATSGMRIHDNYIAGTPGGAVGLAYGTRSNVYVEANTIVDAGGAAAPAVGVWANYDSVRVTGNTIRGAGAAGAFAVCAGTCSDGAGGTGAAGDPDSLGYMEFTGNTVYSNGGVLVRSNATAALDATNNYFVGIDRADPGAIKDGNVNLGDLLPVSPDPVPAYDAHRATGTIPVDNFGAWNMAFDAANDRLYLGTDPMEGSDHPNGSSIVYAYDMSGAAPSLLGSWDVGGTGGRIADMEANPETGQVHVLHAWLDNATIDTSPAPPDGIGWNWYRGGHGWDSPETMGGWGLNLTTLDGADMTEDYAARMSHQHAVLNTTRQFNDYELYPREDALEAELEIDAGRGLLFASTLVHSPIAVLNNSAASPAFEAVGERGNTFVAYERASYVSAMAVNASGSAATVYAAASEWTRIGEGPDGEFKAYLTVVRFGGPGIEDHDRLGRTFVAVEKGGNDQYENRASKIVLDDTADRLFVLWHETQKVSMYALDINMAGEAGLPVFVKDLEGASSPLRDYGARDMSLDEEAGILYTVVRDYTDPRVVAHNTTTGALLGSAPLANEPVSVEVGKNGTVYAAPQQWPNVYVVERSPAPELQRMIDAVPPAAGEYHAARTIGGAATGAGASHLEVDASRGVAYLGAAPPGGAGQPVVRAYGLDGSGGSAVAYNITGDKAFIADMELDDSTGQLHVLHAWLDNATINPSGFFRGQGGWGLNVTTLGGEDLSFVNSSRMSHNHGAPQNYAAQPPHHYGLFPLPEILQADLEVASGRGGLLFVSTTMYSPIGVLNASEPAPEFAVMGDPNTWPGTGWPAANEVSAMAVSASGPLITAYVANTNWTNSGYQTLLTTVRFNTTLGGTGDTLLENYARVGDPVVIAPAVPGDKFRSPVRELALDDARNRLFVLWRNNDTVSMYSVGGASANVGGEAIGIPVFIKNLDGTGAPLDSLAPYDSAGALAEMNSVGNGAVPPAQGPLGMSLDEEAGVLYTAVMDLTDPRVVAHDTSIGSPLWSVSLAAGPAAVAAGPFGTVYAAPRDAPGIYAIERAPPGPAAVVVPDGTHEDTVLVVDRSLTLTSENGTAGDGGPVLTGNSRVLIEAADAAVRGLTFRNLDCLPGLAPPAVELALPAALPYGAPPGAAVEDSRFEDTCHGGIQQKGSAGGFNAEGGGYLGGVTVRNNAFVNVGLNAGGGAPLDTGGEDEFQLVHGAIGLAFHPSQDTVVNAAISGNTIANTSAAGIRVFNADNVRIHGNDISGTPASAVGLSHGSRNSAVFGNTIAMANSEPDMDYMAGVDGSADASYYKRLDGRYVDGDMPYEKWPFPVLYHIWAERLAPHGEAPTPDAAVKVWANSANVSVSSNTIRSSGGAFVACAGTCATESDGIIHAGGTRNVLAPSAYNVSSPANRITFNWNVVHADNDQDGADPLANNATGMLDATRNYYPGYEAGDALVRNASTVAYSPPARGIADVTAAPWTGNDTAGAGDTIVFSVRFNAPTSLDTAGGTPALLFGSGSGGSPALVSTGPGGGLTLGAGSYYSAAYRNGSGTTTLNFAYEVAEGSGSTASALPRAITLGGAEIEDEPNPGAALALPASLDAGDFPAVDGTTRGGGGGGSGTIPVVPTVVVVIEPNGNATSANGTDSAAIRAPSGGMLHRQNDTVITTERAVVTFAPGTNLTSGGAAYTGVINVTVAADERRDAALVVAGADGRIGTVVEIGNASADISLSQPARILLKGQPSPGTVYRMDSTGAAAEVPQCSDPSDPTGMLAPNGTAFCHTVPGGAGATKDYTIHTYLLSAFFVVGGEPDMQRLADSRMGTLTATLVVGAAPPPPPAPTPTAPVATPFFTPGGGGSGGGGGGGGGGRLAPAGTGAVTIYGAAWDCDEGTIRITVNAGILPEVVVLSSEGTVVAQRSEGPHPAGRSVYEATLPGDPILSIRATLAEGRAVSMASEAVRTGGQCAGEMVFTQYGEDAGGEPTQRQPGTAAPDGQPDDAVRQPGTAAPDGQPDAGEEPPRQEQPPADVQPPPAPPADDVQPGDEPPTAGDDAVTPPPAVDDAVAPPPAEEAEEDDQGGCLIATAAHGTELAPQVQLLREVRDNTLMTTESGRAFMSAFGAAYYSFSPQVADLERSHPALRQAVAALVAPMLYALSVVEAAEPGSETDAVLYGSLAIAMVVGMYVAAPAAGLWCAARLVRRGGRPVRRG